MIKKDSGDTLEWNYTDKEDHSDFDNEHPSDEYIIVLTVALMLIICGIIENLIIGYLFERKNTVKALPTSSY